MEFYEAINTRRSVRSYRNDPVPEEVLKRILDAARVAPSANNIQPWHFIVVKDEKRKKEVARLSFDQTFIAEAPVVIVCCGSKYHDRYSWISDNTYIIDVSIAVDHLTLAARNEGLGTCWIGAFDHSGMKKLLEMPENYDVIVLTPLGYPRTNSVFRGTSSRKDLKEIVSYEKFGSSR